MTRLPSLGAGREAALLLSACLALLAPASQAAEGEDYLVGLAALEDGGLGLSAKPFLSALPRLLALRAAPLPPRLADEAYRREAASRRAALEGFELGAALAQKLDAEAALALDPLAAGPEARKRLEAARKASREALAALEARRAQADALPPELLLETRLWEGGASGGLLELGPEGPRALARSAGLDLLLHGRAEPRGAYVALRLSGYEANLDREVFSWMVFADPADPSPLAEELAGRLADWVAGRPYGKLELLVEPPTALVLADGRPFEASSTSLYRFEPSRIILGAWAPGRSSEALALDLLPGERKRLELSLPARSYGRATILSEPPGAALYAEGLYLGTAPLDLDLSGARSVVTAEAPGFEAALAVLPAGGGLYDLELRPRPEDGLGPGARVEAARNRFYGALGWLVLALPAASLSLDAFRSYHEAYLRSGDEAGLLAKRNAAGIGFAASAALGLGFAVNSIFRLGDYVGAAR